MKNIFHHLLSLILIALQELCDETMRLFRDNNILMSEIIFIFKTSVFEQI